MDNFINKDLLFDEINRQRRASKTSFPKTSFCVGDVLNCIIDEPTLKIVRCCECKWFALYGTENTCCHPRLEHHGQATFCKVDDFCSYGEN